MKKINECALGLEELQKLEMVETSGGGFYEWVKKSLGKYVTLIAVWEWINEHWDSFVEGLEDGISEGEEQFIQ